MLVTWVGFRFLPITTDKVISKPNSVLGAVVLLWQDIICYKEKGILGGKDNSLHLLVLMLREIL